MLGFIYRLVQGFELEHNVHPNLLYINRTHSEHLLAAFDGNYTLGQITDMLQMDIIIDPETVHPHVAWTQVGQRVAS